MKNTLLKDLRKYTYLEYCTYSCSAVPSTVQCLILIGQYQAEIVVLTAV